MKRNVLAAGVLLLATLFLVSCGRDKQFSVIGSFSNMPQQQVRLQELRIDDKIIVLDSARTDAEGKFELNTEAIAPGIYQVIFEKGPYIILSHDKGNIRLSGDWKQINDYTVTGSAPSRSVQAFLKVVNEHVQDIQTLDYVIKKKMAEGADSVVAEAQQDMASTTGALTQYIERYADTTAYLPNALFAIRILNPAAEEQYITSFTQTLTRRFGDAPQAKEFTKRWNDMLAQRNSAGQPQQTFTGGPVMGAVAPEISLPSPEGNNVALSSMKGKYVLVDFWASWCRPCRAENPNVVAAYNKFKDKGFTVFGVSLDDDKDRWMEAIKADGLTWTHVSDLKRWENIAARDYAIESIPTNFLLDKDGKIIARDLRGPDLEAKLAEVLQ